MEERTNAESDLFSELSLVWNINADPIERTNTILALWTWLSSVSVMYPSYARRHHLCAFLDSKIKLNGEEFYKRLPVVMKEKLTQDLLAKCNAPTLSQLIRCSNWKTIRESWEGFPQPRGHVLLLAEAYYDLAADLEIKKKEKARDLYQYRLQSKLLTAEEKKQSKKQRPRGNRTIDGYRKEWGRRFPFLWASQKAGVLNEMMAARCPANLFSGEAKGSEEFEQKLKKFGSYLAWALPRSKSPGLKKKEINRWKLPDPIVPDNCTVTPNERRDTKVGSGGRVTKNKRDL
jgi:hypothetical protein